MAKLAEKAAEAVPVLGKMGGTAIRKAVEGLVVAIHALNRMLELERPSYVRLA